MSKPKRKVRFVFEYEPETGQYSIEFASSDNQEVIYPHLKAYLREALLQYENSEAEITIPGNVIKFLH